LPRVQVFALTRMDFTKSEHTNGAMNRTNILPYDGLAYLVDDRGGKFEWSEITSNLAKTIPWRIETACMFGLTCRFRG
jgi:hypothetical protein